MGYAISWIGVKGRDRAAVLEAAGLTDTGEAMEWLGAAPLTMAELPAGWILIGLGRTDDGVKPKLLEPLSRGGLAVGVFVEEHVMYSKAIGYENGARKWSAEHNCERGEMHLEVDGEAPAELAGIAEELRRTEQENGHDADYMFDAPADLFEALTGFSYIKSELEFTRLMRISTDSVRKSGGGFFARLFGGR